MISLFILFIRKNPWILLLFFLYIFIYFFISFKTRGFFGNEFNAKITDFKNGYFTASINNRKVILAGDISGLKVGDIITIKGNFIDFNPITANGYDEKFNFFSKNIFNKFNITSKNITEHNTSFYSLVMKFISSGSLIYKKYTSLILLGKINNGNEYIYNITKELAIVHLFVISGFHIALFYWVLCKILNLFNFKASHISIASMIIIFIYLYLLSFPISSSRAYMFLIFIQINKYFLGKKFSNITLMSFVSIIFILYNPYVLYSLSFILSFLATFMVLLASELKIKNGMKKTIIVSLVVYFAMLPLTINLNNYFSLFGILFSIILTPIISFYYTITLFIFPFKSMASYVYLSLDFILISFSNINYLIEINNIRFSVMFSYYIIYTLCILYEEKISTLLILMKNKLSKKSLLHQ